MKVLRSTLGLTLACSLAAGCGKKKKDDDSTNGLNTKSSDGETPQGAFITSNDIKVGSKTEYTSSYSLEKSLQHSSALFHSNTSTASDNCLMDIASKIKAASTASSYRIAADVDILDCAMKIFSQTGGFTKINSARLKLWYALDCDNSDLSVLDNQAIKSVGSFWDPEHAICKNATQIRSHFNMKLSIDFSQTRSGHTLAAKVVFYGSGSTPDGKACVATPSASKDGTFVIDNCVDFSKTVYEIAKMDGKSLDQEGQENTTILTAKKLVATTGKETWFNSGSVGVQINDWNGTVDYTGSDTPPTYSMSNPKYSSEKTTGTLSPYYGLVDGDSMAGVLERDFGEVFQMFEK